jgi:hypothetical protein
MSSLEALMASIHCAPPVKGTMLVITKSMIHAGKNPLACFVLLDNIARRKEV